MLDSIGPHGPDNEFATTALRSAVAVFAACLALSATAPAHAQPTAAEPSILMEPELLMAGLASNHNDLYFRRIALQALAEGRPHRGIRYLRRAAEYADKPAQALMAEILWQGSHGQQQDRAAAYAWMDLAAERGYPELLRQREAYWAALDPQERERALAEGQELYARYGDDVARPRLGHQLRRQAAKQTGVGAGRRRSWPCSRVRSRSSARTPARTSRATSRHRWSPSPVTSITTRSTGGRRCTSSTRTGPGAWA
ncbi:hypothetical protein [Stenotrophomonas sp. Marseille-Q4652]|uniref:hypothetical protein n=1 Tax=Stenotrophomonas sp. Marseille-Q4652 TaxID=2866595 RepID=UPI001CE48EF5|nr:hypothetical protein [Stenotrophomonas sp. Marseille-Q4652]